MCKNKCFCFNEVVWLWQWKWGWNWKKRSHRYNIERPRPRHGHKYTKYKMCLSIMMVLCIKQHLSNIWSWIHKKLRNTDASLKKKALLIKKSVYYVYLTTLSMLLSTGNRSGTTICCFNLQLFKTKDSFEYNLISHAPTLATFIKLGSNG